MAAGLEVFRLVLRLFVVPIGVSDGSVKWGRRVKDRSEEATNNRRKVLLIRYYRYKKVWFGRNEGDKDERKKKGSQCKVKKCLLVFNRSLKCGDSKSTTWDEPYMHMWSTTKKSMHFHDSKVRGKAFKHIFIDWKALNYDRSKRYF
jgi:hypothetical protein